MKKILNSFFFLILFFGVSETLFAQNFDQIIKLHASDPGVNDLFGYSVSISGDYALVGAFLENTGGNAAGAAYIYQKDVSGNWGEVKKLQSNDLEAGDRFGISVSISGDYALVGADREDTGGNSAGSAYIYKKDQGGASNWGEVKKLLASDAEVNDRFGFSVSIFGDYALVGAFNEDAGGNNAGSAYIYKKDGGGTNNWGEVQKLLASDPGPGDFFGYSVSIFGDYALVGALLEDGGGNNAGSAYIYKKDGGGTNNWGEVKKLQSSDPRTFGQFSFSVSIFGDYALVGASNEDAGGAAYIYKKDQGGASNWGEVKKLQANDLEAGDGFGYSVSISGDYALVGARGEDTGGSNAGAAYIYKKDEGGTNNWGEVQKLQSNDLEAGDLFGHSVSISGDYALVGAWGEDTGGSNAGAAYIFAPSPPLVINDEGIDDPCACDLNGSGTASGTFKETVTVMSGVGTTENWTIFSIAPLNTGGVDPVTDDGSGNATSTALATGAALTSVGAGKYEITFHHNQLDGYQMTVRRDADPSTDLTISNVCAVPSITSTLQSSYASNAPTVTLGTNIMVSNGGIAAAGFPMYNISDGTSSNAVTQLSFDPTTTNLPTGQLSLGTYTLTTTYETDGTGSGSGGTLATPAVPTNTCPVADVATIIVAQPVPTLGQWGLITLALLLLITGMVMATAPQLTTAQGQSVSFPTSRKNMPFDSKLFYKIFPVIALLFIGGFSVAAAFFGYEWTSADPIGIVVTIPLMSYLVMVVVKAEQEKG